MSHRTANGWNDARLNLHVLGLGVPVRLAELYRRQHMTSTGLPLDPKHGIVQADLCDESVNPWLSCPYQPYQKCLQSLPAMVIYNIHTKTCRLRSRMNSSRHWGHIIGFSWSQSACMQPCLWTKAAGHCASYGGPAQWKHGVLHGLQLQLHPSRPSLGKANASTKGSSQSCRVRHGKVSSQKQAMLPPACDFPVVVLRAARSAQVPGRAHSC